MNPRGVWEGCKKEKTIRLMVVCPICNSEENFRLFLLVLNLIGPYISNDLTFMWDFFKGDFPCVS